MKIWDMLSITHKEIIDCLQNAIPFVESAFHQQSQTLSDRETESHGSKILQA
jgi:hypothetical protein